MTDFKAVIFDCDGVILQSNRLKSDAFGTVLKEYDAQQVDDFVSWHKATGGVSRFHKFAHFFQNVRKVRNWEDLTHQACEDFGTLVSKGLLTCDTVPGFKPLVQTLHTQGVRLAVNTGGAEAEVRQVFATRGMADEFDIILGSPTTKHRNMEKLCDMGIATSDCAYFGDSELDFELAKEFGLAFYYVAYESEWHAGAAVTRAAGGTVIPDLHMETGLLRNHI